MLKGHPDHLSLLSHACIMNPSTRAVLFVPPIPRTLFTRSSSHLHPRQRCVPARPLCPRARSTLPEKQTYRPPERPPDKNLPRVNRFLASRRLTATFIALSIAGYITAILLLAHAITLAPGPQRVVLLGLGVLLPDFRHVLRTYADAVRALQGYRPFAIRLPKRKEVDVQKEEDRDWVREGVERVRQTVSPDIVEKFDEFMSNWSRDVTRPIVETGTQIQQLTTGTDLTLRRNVVVAAVSINLSLAGYIACVVGEIYIGGVAIMLAGLLHTALLARNRHEMLALANDVRVVLSLLGVLSCVVAAMFPAAVYVFLLCCVALVAMRFPTEMVGGL